MTETAVCKWCQKSIKFLKCEIYGKPWEGWEHVESHKRYCHTSTNAEPSPAVPQAPNDQPGKFRFFRCLSCGFSGTITTEEVGNHRAQCAHGPTVAVDSVTAPAAQTVPIPEDLLKRFHHDTCQTRVPGIIHCDCTGYKEQLIERIARVEATIADERKISAKLSDAWGKLNEQLQNAEAIIAELVKDFKRVKTLHYGEWQANGFSECYDIARAAIARATGKEL